MPRHNRDARLRLDGEARELVSLALDGRPVVADRYRFDAHGALVITGVITIAAALYWVLYLRPRSESRWGITNPGEE